MPNSVELREQRAALVKQMRDTHEKAEQEKRSMSAEETQTFDRLAEEVRSLKQSIDRVELLEAEAEETRALEQREREQRGAQFRQDPQDTPASGDGEEEPREVLEMRALAGWLRAGSGDEPTEQEQRAAQTLGVGLGRGAFGLRFDGQPIRGRHVGSEVRAAQTTGTAGTGGNIVPTTLLSTVEQAMLPFGPMRQVARIMRTESGEEMGLPTVDDTDETGEGIVAENTAASNTDQEITFGKKALNAYKLGSGLILVPTELLEDSVLNLAQLIGELLGERLGRKQNAQLTTGTGSSQPNGVVTASTLGKTAAATAAFTLDELKDLYYSVNSAYRANASWMMNDTAIAALSKLKASGSGEYLWQPGVQAGQPDMLIGKPVLANQDMADPAASAKSVLFGDMSRYLIREVRSIRLVRMNERYAEKDQVGFVAWLRHDGELMDAGTNPVKHLIQAAAT